MEEKKNKSNKNKNHLNAYAKYSAIAFQMVAIILAGVFGGIKLDEYLNISFPLFTLIFTILAVIFANYYVIKDLLK